MRPSLLSCRMCRLNGRRSRSETELRIPERTNANTKRM